VACALIVVWMAGYGQPYYPMTWLDEGFTLGGAVSLVRDGTYALRSSEGLRVLDEPLVANGPGVVVPIAVVFKIFGVGLPQARALMAVFASVTAWAFFLVARRLSGTRAAFVSLVLLLTLPLVWKGDDAAGFVVFGRQALGNVPALCYFLVGFLLWQRGQGDRRAATMAAGGLFLGLATVTKSQYLVIVPAIALLGTLQFLWTRDRRALLAPGLLLLGIGTCQATWWAVQLHLVGWTGFSAHLEAIRSTSHTTVTALRPSRIPGSLSYLVRSGYAAVVLPSLGFALWRCRLRDPHASGQLLLVVVGAVWAVWYAAVSVGWPRYAFEPYALGLLLSGQAVVASAELIGRAYRERGSGNMHGTTHWWAGAFLTATVGAATLGGSQHVSALLEPAERSPQEFASHLLAHVPQTAIVESWEWELDVLADLTYHHPETIWLDRYTALLQFRDAVPRHYDPLAHDPEYLVDGPFSKRTGIYAAFLSRGGCELVYRAGPYDLYRITRGVR
jgi:hypothetical protein